eukprot:3875887-Rhodomonas_salina.1
MLTPSLPPSFSPHCRQNPFDVVKSRVQNMARPAVSQGSSVQLEGIGFFWSLGLLGPGFVDA